MLKPNGKIEPVIKWSGSKRKVAPTISSHIPAAKRYIEPFLGGGSMLPFRRVQTAVAGDIIPELVELWKAIRDTPEMVASEYQTRWEKLQENWEFYYQARETFNKNKNPFDFLFLTRTCVNGMIRYNDKGEFNNSLHVTRPGIKPQTLREIILKWSYFVKDVDFVLSDYRNTLGGVTANDFVFLDPPYGGTKDRYTREEFDLEKFYKELDRLNSVGAKWILTFDGVAGEREYKFDLPKEIYQHKIYVKTGNSPFTKMMKTTIDAVYESVYLNFQPTGKLICDLHQNVAQKATLFG
jgi:DNA adenine methylase